MKKLTVFLFAIISLSVFGQDRIIKKSGAIIEAKVSEIAVDEVKYYYSENPKLVFGIDKVLVDKIEFSTGEVMVMEGNSFKNREYYNGQGKNAIKINFLSPALGSTEFIYEKSINPGKSWETALGIIGLGFDSQENKARGVYGKFAYKFIKDPDFYMQRMHFAHILKGAYLAPELAVRYLTYEKYGYYYGNNYNNYTPGRGAELSMAIFLKFGKQWIFDNSFLVDLYGGIGYGIEEEYDDALTYGYVVMSEVPIALTGGIRIGWVFGKK